MLVLLLVLSAVAVYFWFHASAVPWFIIGFVWVRAVVMLFLRLAVWTGLDIDDALGGARQRSCEDAVRALPNVPLDAPELLDPEDGQPLECVICSEEHSAVVGLDVVRTPCGHL